jgi:tetratricopeptide (TPR) repeat protein
MLPMTRKFPLRPLACGSFLCSTVILLACPAYPADAGDASDAVRQLIQSTSVVSILRTDAEQASLIINHLPEDLPAVLRSDLRRVLDENLRYDAMEQALIQSVATTLDSSTLDANLRWWASGSGGAITKAESGIYAAMFADSTFNAFNPAIGTPQPADPNVVEEVIVNGQFDHFVADLLESTEAARSCLVKTVNMGSECAPHDMIDVHDEPDTAALAQNIALQARARYSQLSGGDLQAYTAYLKSAGARATINALRTVLVAIEAQRWDGAMKQASLAIDRYARANFAATKDATLRLTMAELDQGRNLGRAHMTLDLIRRADPSDPAVLVQLARVTLMQAQNLTERETPASVPRLDPDSLRAAQDWVDRALKLDAHRADTLLMDGHVAYLEHDFKRSVDLLEQARTAGSDSPWLHINLGDAYWAMGAPPVENKAFAQRAADEFEAALKTKLPPGAKEEAVHQLGAIYAELGQLQKADAFQRQNISQQVGIGKAFALDRYALFLLFYAHDIDGAVAAERRSAAIADYPLGRAFLVWMLAVKGGMLYESGRAAEAAPYLAEAHRVEPDLESVCPDLARFPVTFPGVLGIHDAGFVTDFSGTLGGKTLVHASLYATAGDLEKLLAWGADPNYFDPEEGAPLHAAVLAENAVAVKVLLAHGANPLTPSVDGRMPSQIADQPSDPKAMEIKLLIDSAVGSRPSATGPIGTPLKVGYRYRLKKNVDNERWGYSFKAGVELTFLRNCQYTDPSLACFFFRDEKYPTSGRDMALAKDQLSSWTDWFEELGPDNTTPVTR